MPENADILTLNRGEIKDIELRYHHVTSLYSQLCMSAEEQARTPLFNHEYTYGLDLN